MVFPPHIVWNNSAVHTHSAYQLGTYLEAVGITDNAPMCPWIMADAQFGVGFGGVALFRVGPWWIPF